MKHPIVLQDPKCKGCKWGEWRETKQWCMWQECEKDRQAKLISESQAYGNDCPSGNCEV